MKTLLIVIAFLLAFAFLAASVYIIITQPQNKDAWGWLMFCGVFLGAGAMSSID